jgi:hypothetical protein
MDEDELDELRARAVALRAESARLLRELDAEPWYLRRWPYLSGTCLAAVARLEELERARTRRSPRSRPPWPLTPMARDVGAAQRQGRT